MLLQAEAEKLSLPDLQAGVIEEIVEVDDLFSVLQFDTTKGKSYDYVRENGIGAAQWIDPVTGVVPENAATFTEITTRLRVLASQVEIDNFLASTDDDTNDQVAEQIRAKSKVIAQKFKQTLINGNNGGTAQEPDGLQVLTPAAQTIPAGANGGALTLGMLDELVDAVKYGPDAIFAPQSVIRAYKALLRTTAGGTDAVMMQLENFGKPVLTHAGIPILQNDYILKNETQGTNNNTTSIYAVRTNTADGFHGLIGGDAGGIRFTPLGHHATKDAQTYRLVWYASFALKATNSVARVNGLTNI